MTTNSRAQTPTVAQMPGIALSRRTVLGSALALTAARAGAAVAAAGAADESVADPSAPARDGRFVIVSGWVLTRADVEKLGPGRDR